MVWIYLDKGQFNYIYRSEDRKKVLKVRISTPEGGSSDCRLDEAERAVRVWNEVNFGVAEEAELIEHEELAAPSYRPMPFVFDPKPMPIPPGLGWTVPFVDGRDSTQSEICEALINIFNRSGRVVLDATQPGNFKTVVRNGVSQVICVDIGQSLKLQREDGLRKKSELSLTVWDELAQEIYIPWLKIKQDNPKYQKTILMIKALFTLQRQFPYIINADFLKDAGNKDILEALAKDFDNKDPQKQISTRILTKLERIKPKDIKEACLSKLDQYINSRGAINKTGNFSPSVKTKIFRQEVLTKKKIAFALALKERIQNTPLAELQEEIREILSNSADSLIREGCFFKSELKKTVQAIHDLIAQHNNELEIGNILMRS